MKLVVDASVSLKWILDPSKEADSVLAHAVLRAILVGTHSVVQPPHWTAEVLAVVAREEPAKITSTLDLFDLVGAEIAGGSALLHRAATMSTSLKHHQFDTLYHAVALEHGATLVTADIRYLTKASGLGHITDLINLP